MDTCAYSDITFYKLKKRSTLYLKMTENFFRVLS